MTFRPRFLYSLAFCLILVFKPDFSFEQTLNFRQFKTSDGLPSPFAYNVFQDAKGYIWVSTMLGAVKHNGRRFVPVCRNVSIPDQNFYAFAEGPDHTMYVSTHRNRIYKIQNDSAILIKGTDVFRHAMAQVIIQMCIEENGDIYFSSFSNTYHYIKDSDTVVLISTGDTTQPDQVNFIQKGNTYLQVRNNFGESKRFKPFALAYVNEHHPPLRLPHLGVFSRIALHKQNGFDYFTDGRTIFKMKNGAVLTDKKIKGYLSLSPAPDGNLWLLTTNGALVLGPDLDSIATYLQGRMVSSVCFDRSGGIWATTLGHGVYYCNDLQERNLFPDNNPENQLNHLSQNHNKLFFATAQGDLYSITDFSVTHIFHFDQPQHITGVMENNDEYMIATKRRILLLSKHNHSLKELNDERNLPLGLENMNAFYGDTLIGKSGTSLMLLYHNRVIKRYFSQTMTHSVVVLDQNNCLITNVDGVWKLDWRNLEIRPIDTTIKKKNIIKAGIDPYGNLWLCSDFEGIIIRSPKGKTTLLTDLPFATAPFMQFYKNMVILSTNMGVFRSNLKTSGLPTEWINILKSPTTGMAIHEHFLWMATEDGLLSLDLDQFEDHSEYPIAISSIWSNGQQVPAERSEFHYTESNLRFNFDFLNYKNTVTGFYFELKGAQNMRGNITGHSLQFQQLQPGHYSLKIFPLQGEAYNNDFFLEKKFTIEPAYWQTAWFRIVIILMIVSITAIVVAVFYNRKRKKAEVSALLAEYKLTALKAQINPHFISNSLAAIQLLIDSGNVVKANQYIAKFSLLIRHVLKYSDQSATRLSDEIKIIGLNVELEQLRFVNSFSFKIIIDEDIDPDDIYIPPLITQPFVENAIWHGLIPLNAEHLPELIMKVEKIENELIISIIDNGVGRHHAHQVKNTQEDNIRESKGTVLIQKRIENLNNLYRATAHLKMIDLVDENAKPKGTCVRITFPLPMLNQLQEQI